MQNIGDLVAEGREREGSLFEPAERATPFSYRDFCTNAWKVGNLLRHYGVREGAGSPSSPDQRPRGRRTNRAGSASHPTRSRRSWALPSTAPSSTWTRPAPSSRRYSSHRTPGWTTTSAGPARSPSPTAARRRTRGSPTSNAKPGARTLQPPGEFGPENAVLAADRTYTHGDLLAASHRVVAEYDLTAEDRIALRAPVTEPGTIVAGLLAPMRAGATVLLGNGETGTVAVAAEDVEAPEERVILPDDAAP